VRAKVLLFDFYATLVDIETDEHDWRAWDVVSRFLRYRGSRASAEGLKESYIEYVNAALDATGERHPDVDVVPIFRRIMDEAHVEPSDTLARTVAQLFRSLTLRKFRLFPETRQVVEALAARFTLALVTDSQEPYVMPELRQTGLADAFATVVISSTYGYRKPDTRLFRVALQQLGIAASEAVYIGDSWPRDVVGASDAGIHPIWIRRERGEPKLPDNRPVTVLPDLRGLLELQPLKSGGREISLPITPG